MIKVYAARYIDVNHICICLLEWYIEPTKHMPKIKCTLCLMIVKDYLSKLPKKKQLIHLFVMNTYTVRWMPHAPLIRVRWYQILIQAQLKYIELKCRCQKTESRKLFCPSSYKSTHTCNFVQNGHRSVKLKQDLKAGHTSMKHLESTRTIR